MRRWVVGGLAVLVVAGIGAGVYLLRPVEGPARDLTLVGDAAHGAQLMRLGGCVACHTDAPNGRAMLAGGPALPTPFGTFYAPNITPHPVAGIGTWTLAQFSRAMSDGEGPQGHLYPAFPYESYTLMSDQEIADLYAALQDVPVDATPSKPHEVGFPFNLRPVLAGWKNVFFKPQRYAADASKSEQWNRGRYLAIGPGHCVTCHSPRNALGGIDAGSELAGNPAGGPGGRAPSLRAADLAEDGYDAAALAQTLSDGFTPNFDVLGGAMGEVITEGTSRWTQQDRDAVAAYLTGAE
ncbi:MAG: c-type cytochrome [Hyphomicrobiales bacterium]|nr:MAG: c-type cytochrome [Hyphomicrobiales bacterium]